MYFHVSEKQRKTIRYRARVKKTYKSYVFAGILIEPENILLNTNNGWEVDLKPVVINRSRVIRARPRFDAWMLDFTVEINDPIITPSSLKQFIVDAGKYNGLLDFRPLYGLFELLSYEKVEENDAHL